METFWIFQISLLRFYKSTHYQAENAISIDYERSSNWMEYAFHFNIFEKPVGFQSTWLKYAKRINGYFHLKWKSIRMYFGITMKTNFSAKSNEIPTLLGLNTQLIQDQLFFNWHKIKFYAKHCAHYFHNKFFLIVSLWLRLLLLTQNSQSLPITLKLLNQISSQCSDSNIVF